MTTRTHTIALALAVAFAAIPAGAQLSAPNATPPVVPTTTPVTQTTDSATASPVVPRGPVLRTSAVDVQPAPKASLGFNGAELASTSRTQSRAMMIVGGAALITGAIIGGNPGTIVMVGGAVVGLIGLYDYLQ